MKLNNNKESLNESENEVKSLTQSLYTFFGLFAILIIIFIITLYSRAASTWMDSLFIATMVYLCLVAFWVLIRFGFAETTILRAKNFQKARINKQENNKRKNKITISDLKRERKLKNWIGPIVSTSVGMFLLVIALIFTYI